MAVLDRDLAAGPDRRWRPHRWSRIGVGALVASNAADALTTTVGLLYLSMYEANPVMRSLFVRVGVVPGVIIGSVLAIVLLTIATEVGASLVIRYDGDHDWARRVRYLGYGLPTAIFTAVAAQNLALILTLL